MRKFDTRTMEIDYLDTDKGLLMVNSLLNDIAYKKNFGINIERLKDKKERFALELGITKVEIDDIIKKLSI